MGPSPSPCPLVLPPLVQYLEKLGFPTAMFRFHDVMSTEEWALEMIPQPVLAVVMLFPIKDAVRGMGIFPVSPSGRWTAPFAVDGHWM